MFLPNGTHIYFKNPTIEGIERLRGMIERGVTITCTSVDSDGTETTHVLWHPDDPVMLFEQWRDAVFPRPCRRHYRLRIGRHTFRRRFHCPP